MKRIVSALLLCAVWASVGAERHLSAVCNGITYCGNYIVYEGDTIRLNEKTFFIDGSLGKAETDKYPYVFNTINEAVKYLIPGTEREPMRLYIAPWVYWIDNPDDPAVRRPQSGGTPYGLMIDCPGLSLIGLTHDPRNVVLACNRGQTMGAVGNFTMLHISGDDITCENLTLGNYCNVDLEYPLRPELSRKRRGSAIVQAQLVICNSDRVVCRNVHFISRLNTCNFVGARRALFERCHIECTDDALCGTGVYLDCTFTFYAPRPFGHTEGTGAVLLNCDITSMVRGTQYFVKGGGPLTIIDTRVRGEHVTDLAWRDHPAREERYYYNNVTLNGEPCVMGKNSPETSCVLSNSGEHEYGYRIQLDGDTLYNTYNLLQGNDDWDPCGVKSKVLTAEKHLGHTLSEHPTKLTVTPSRRTIETGREGVTLTTTAYRQGGYNYSLSHISWHIDDADTAYVRITPSADGLSCYVESIHDSDEVREVAVKAYNGSGEWPGNLQGAAIVYARPRTLPTPEFTRKPQISYSNGVLSLDYALASNLPDHSCITWYRCSDAQGNNAIPVATSHLDKPLRRYTLTAGDEGYYLMVGIRVRNIRCVEGEEQRVVYGRISGKKIKGDKRRLETDFSTLPTGQQPRLIPGFWSLDGYKPADTNDYDWTIDNTYPHWYYGRGINGAYLHTGLVQSRVGARLRYTPIAGKYDDMRMELTACPAKTAGQGFASARQQYLDIFIKFDHHTRTGYALRLIRTTKYGNAVDFVLLRYDHGMATPLCAPVSSSCFRTPCHITIEVVGDTLRATAHTDSQYYLPPEQEHLRTAVDISAPIPGNPYGGFGLQHTGTVHGGATLLRHLSVEWQ
ncbi:MAG: hypothetical protein IJY36_04760 [Coprobacter sp.]|nr:hypothetical protein [Coprobacter sp.]